MDDAESWELQCPQNAVVEAKVAEKRRQVYVSVDAELVEASARTDVSPGVAVKEHAEY